MQFHNLVRKIKNKKPKQVGRGGTRGKTSGRGTKGQNARAGRKKRPEMRDIIKRVPKLRGRGTSSLKSLQKKLSGQALKKHLAKKKNA
ncbi:MAG: uL15 family ribosomal protein [Candidatus Zambryskibacteria bacterium]|nr:uL15 family ribosomal protein [Candidatus Zambryskibacteria bacterium]